MGSKMNTKKQIKNWERYYGRPISETVYKEICDNLNGFFSILKEWDDIDKMENKKDGNSLPNKRPK